MQYIWNGLLADPKLVGAVWVDGNGKMARNKENQCGIASDTVYPLLE